MACFILFCFFSVIVLILSTYGAAKSYADHCSTRSCDSTDTYSIHFPFRLPQYQPDVLCGYSSNFTLSCSSKNETHIALPGAGSFSVQRIDYSSDTILVTDPNGCLPRRFLDFDLSDSAFYSYSTNYTFYNCTPSKTGGYNPIPCMSSSTYKTVAVPWYEIYNLPNCPRMKSVQVPSQDSPELISHIELYWRQPVCRYCVSNGGVCGFDSGFVGCRYSSSTAESSDNGSGKPRRILIGVVSAALIPALLIMTCVAVCKCRKNTTTPRNRQSTSWNPEIRPIHHQPTIMRTGLNNSAIESYPKYVLGEGDVLLEPDTNPCAICLSEYKPYDMLRTIPDCNHYFHADCVDEWLKIKAICPVCRKAPDAT